MRRLLNVLTLTAIILVASLYGSAAQAAPRERCFPETGQCVSGAILEYWEKHGGLPIFGYPITPQRVETVEGTWTGPVQWFERDRLEDHSNEGLGVLAGRLGARLLEFQARPWSRGTETRRPGAALCTYHEQTGYNVCPPFRLYWEQNGGLERFGYPITPVIEEQVEGKVYQVQYFERRRMEYHPENAGTPYEVLLGLLGREVQQVPEAGLCPEPAPPLRATAIQFYNQIGCPIAGGRSGVPIAVQPFARGWLLWVSHPDGAVIYAVVRNTRPNGGPPLTYTAFTDTWREGDPIEPPAELRPSGGYKVIRGFGKVIAENQSLLGALGEVLGEERGDVGSVQPFPNGAVMIYRNADDRVLTLLPGKGGQPSTAIDTPRVK
jgi:hypothetical protein